MHPPFLRLVQNLTVNNPKLPVRCRIGIIQPKGMLVGIHRFLKFAQPEIHASQFPETLLLEFTAAPGKAIQQFERLWKPVQLPVS